MTHIGENGTLFNAKENYLGDVQFDQILRECSVKMLGSKVIYM